MSGLLDEGEEFKLDTLTLIEHYNNRENKNHYSDLANGCYEAANKPPGRKGVKMATARHMTTALEMDRRFLAYLGPGKCKMDLSDESKVHYWADMFARYVVQELF